MAQRDRDRVRKGAPDRARKEEGGAQTRKEVGGKAGRGAGAAAAADRRGQEDGLDRLLRPWWVREPARLRREIKALDEAGFAVRRKIDVLGRLTLRLQRGRELLTVTYSSGFPRASVIAHQGHGPATSRTALGISGPGDNPAGLLAVAHVRFQKRDVASFSFDKFGVLLPSTWALLNTGTGGELEVGRALEGTAILPLTIRGAGNTGIALSIWGLGLQAAFRLRRPGWWARGEAPDWSKGPHAVANVIEELVAERNRLTVPELRALITAGYAALAYPSATRPDETERLFLQRRRNGEARFGRNTPLEARDFDVRAPFAQRLEGKRVAIIGCGSLGWPIAVGLARAGIRAFTLFDLDRLWPGNLARLGAGIGQVGEFKAEALASTLRQVAAWIDATSVTALAGYHVGARALTRVRPDLIIDATAEELSPPDTNAAAIALGVPVLYAWMTYTVRAARIFRVVPGRTACYACVARSNPKSVVGSDGQLSPNGIWDGANFNIDAVAAAAVRMAVRTLIDEEVGPKNPDHVVMRFGGALPTAQALHIRRDPKCDHCGAMRP